MKQETKTQPPDETTQEDQPQPPDDGICDVCLQYADVLIECPECGLELCLNCSQEHEHPLKDR